MILGIQDLERKHSGSYGGITRLFPKDIEDIVVKNEESLIQNQRKGAEQGKKDDNKKSKGGAQEIATERLSK